MIGRFFLLILLWCGITLIPNFFFWSDELRFAAYLRWGESALNSHHFLSNVSAYAFWKFFSFFNFEMSAIEAIRMRNAFFSALGVVSLFDLSVFLGFSVFRSLLFILPYLCAGSFLRYSVSLYGAPSAIGIGLLGFNLLYRSFLIEKYETLLLLLSAFLFGISALHHATVLSLLPGFGILVFLLSYKKDCLKDALKRFFYFSGMTTFVFSLGMYLYFWIKGHYPVRVYDSMDAMGFIYKFDRIQKVFKTGWGLAFSAVRNNSNEALFWVNIPRLCAVGIVFLALAFLVSKRKLLKTETKLILTCLLWGALPHFLILFLTYAESRQYAISAWVTLAPVFIFAAKAFYESVAKNSKDMRIVEMLYGVLSICFLYHCILGKEGILDLQKPRTLALMKFFEPYEIDVKMKAPAPWFSEAEKKLPHSKLYDAPDANEPEL